MFEAVSEIAEALGKWEVMGGRRACVMGGGVMGYMSMDPFHLKQPWQPGRCGLKEECDGEEVRLGVAGQRWGGGRSALVFPEASIK